MDSLKVIGRDKMTQRISTRIREQDYNIVLSLVERLREAHVGTSINDVVRLALSLLTGECDSTEWSTWQATFTSITSNDNSTSHDNSTLQFTAPNQNVALSIALQNYTNLGKVVRLSNLDTGVVVFDGKPMTDG